VAKFAGRERLRFDVQEMRKEGPCASSHEVSCLSSMGSKRNPSPGSAFCGEGSSYGVVVSHRFGSVGSCICAFVSRLMMLWTGTLNQV
jgi:hypothetical protein